MVTCYFEGGINGAKVDVVGDGVAGVGIAAKPLEGGGYAYVLGVILG